MRSRTTAMSVALSATLLVNLFGLTQHHDTAQPTIAAAVVAQPEMMPHPRPVQVRANRSHPRRPIVRHTAAPAPVQPQVIGGLPWPWNVIARCESGSEPTKNTGNGFYGEFQFTEQTWLAYGGGAYASRADLASSADQLVVAERTQRGQGWGAWPVCSKVAGAR